MKKKALLTSLALLLVAVICLGTATYAWFASATSVTATGMKVTTAAGSSLVISKDGACTQASGTTADFQNTTAINLTPATADANHDIVTLSTADIAKVNTNTGRVEDGQSFQYDGTVTAGTHYIDYRVNIASIAAAQTGKTVNCTITFGTHSTQLNATKVQVRKGAGASSVYVGEASAASGTAVIPLTNVDIGLVGGTTEVNSEVVSTDLVVTLRVYIDGDAAEDGTNNYIRTSNSLNIGDLGITATFAIPSGT
jgi:hypothetical protein